MGKRVLLYIVLCCFAATIYSGCSYKTDANTQQNTKKKDLVLEIPEPCTYGRIIVYDEHVETFSYSGEIHIINDGKDGEQIKIIVNVQENTY